jgi:hypothetical protein
MSRQKWIVVVLLAFSIGSLLGTGGADKPVERPFLKILATAARIGLRLMVFEPPPPEECRRLPGDELDHCRSL